MKIRCYNELKQLSTFEERYRYLKLGGEVGKETFGYDRIFNQAFYQSADWKRARRDVIVRDEGCDLGIAGREIFDKIIIHHMNPITLEQIEEGGEELFDPRYLICVTHNTHNAIHYGDEKLLLPSSFNERTPWDTCPWKQKGD